MKNKNRKFKPRLTDFHMSTYLAEHCSDNDREGVIDMLSVSESFKNKLLLDNSPSTIFERTEVFKPLASYRLANNESHALCSIYYYYFIIIFIRLSHP